MVFKLCSIQRFLSCIKFDVRNILTIILLLLQWDFKVFLCLGYEMPLNNKHNMNRIEYLEHSGGHGQKLR